MDLTEKKLLMKKENARMEKWNEMLINFDNYFIYDRIKFTKLKSRTRKGIPDCYRGIMWQKFADVFKYKNDVNFKEEYKKIINDESVDLSNETVILRDIDRTFPKHAFFKDKYGLGQRSLFTCLKAYSKFNKKVGYVQGMGFLCAVFLTYMDEESTFWLMHSLMENPKYNLQGLYSPNFPDLQLTFYKFMSLLKKHLNKVYEHLVIKYYIL